MRDGAAELAAEPGHDATDQFNMPDGVPATCMLGHEIWEQTDGRSPPSVTGLGTGTSVVGVGEALKARNEAVDVSALEPAVSPALTGGPKGSFRHPGSDGGCAAA